MLDSGAPLNLDRVIRMTIDGVEYCDVMDLKRASGFTGKPFDLFIAFLGYAYSHASTVEEHEQIRRRHFGCYEEYHDRGDSYLFSVEGFLIAVDYYNRLGPVAIEKNRKVIYQAAGLPDPTLRVPEPENKPRKPSTVPKPSTDPMVGYVYLVAYKEIPGLYKIGRSLNIEGRLAGLKAGMPYEPILVDSVKCEDSGFVEGRLHERYASKQYRREWFQLTDQDVLNVKTFFAIYDISEDAEGQAQ